MNAYQDQVEIHQSNLIEQVREICNRGSITELDTFLCSPNGYQYGVASASSLSNGLLSAAMRAVLLHDRWNVLEHVIPTYNLQCSVLPLIDLDIPTVRRPTVEWVHKVGRILNEFILPRLPVDHNYRHHMQQIATSYAAYSVWWGFQRVEWGNAVIHFLNYVTRTALRYWDADMEFFFNFMLQQSNTKSVLEALQVVANLDPKYTACIEEELHKRKIETMLQGTHVRLGAASHLHHLEPELIRYIVDKSWPATSDT